MFTGKITLKASSAFNQLCTSKGALIHVITPNAFPDKYGWISSLLINDSLLWLEHIAVMVINTYNSYFRFEYKQISASLWDSQYILHVLKRSYILKHIFSTCTYELNSACHPEEDCQLISFAVTWSKMCAKVVKSIFIWSSCGSIWNVFMFME